jgi:hypothetical protein
LAEDGAVVGGASSTRPVGGVRAVSPFTRIAIEAAVLIIGLIVVAILVSYLMGVFTVG